MLLLFLAALAIGIGAYNAGFSKGLEESGRAGEVVRVIDRGPVFFPFGLFLFPLLLIGIFALHDAVHAAPFGRASGSSLSRRR